MQISSSFTSSTLSLASQTFQGTFSGEGGFPFSPSRDDQVELSEDALASARTLADTVSAHRPERTLQMLRDLVSILSGGDVEGITPAEKGDGVTVPSGGSPAPGSTIGADEVAVSAEHFALSMSGTISTRDGKGLGFSLDIRYDHAMVAAQTSQMDSGVDGVMANFAGIAAEVSSTSFSFSLTGGDGSRGGSGSFHLNDEISHIGKVVKPLVKELAGDSSRHGEWGEINRFLRSVA